jgi:hypothetical protein
MDRSQRLKELARPGMAQVSDGEIATEGANTSLQTVVDGCEPPRMLTTPTVGLG